jgi:CubicO group peptidase (beta-lactamase class C family)
MKIKFILLIAVTVIVTTTAFSQQKDERIDSLKKELANFILKKMKSSKTVGLSIAIVDNQDIVWAEGFGFADQVNQIKVSPSTIYRVGSVSKLFTAISVMQLAEKGKLNIDSPIQNYIPEFNIKSRLANQGVITPKNLLTHHSGIPSDIYHQFFSNNPEPFTKIVNYLNDEYTCTQPNTIFSYSNAGYSLLGVLVEKASNENFIDYTQKYLFDKMDMKNTSFKLNPEMEKLYSKGYSKKKEFNEPFIRDVPAGMLHTNVLDLSNFIKMTFNDGKFGDNQIIEKETLAKMQSQQNLDCILDGNFKIGLSWFINPSEWDYAGKYAEHGGDTYVYHAQLSTLTDHKIGVVVLTNTDKGAQIASSIADELLEKYLTYKTGLKSPKDDKKSKKTDYVKSNDKRLNELAGDYMIGEKLFVIQKQGKKLIAKQGPVKIIFRENKEGNFSLKARLLKFIPVNMSEWQISPKKMDETDYISMIHNKKDTMVVGVRISKQEIPEIWKERYGKYEITNDTSTFKLISKPRLFEKDGYMQIEISIFGEQGVSAVLKPISENEAIIQGIGRNTGGTLFYREDEIYFSGIQMTKVFE